ncbi:MAG: 3-deoxy-manno-octulosonate cytidylyltransferase [Bacteroidales bacterium]|nr:3-deoxy-manno-octulosonate cytidylyltransferase [Bacteroidales bacterium]
MNVLGIIPARYASVRFPGKPLVEIHGESMIMRVYNQAMKCISLSEVVVATDDERIYAHVEASGGKALMTSASHRSGTERCSEAYRLVQGHFGVVINIQGDEPFIRPEQISQVVECFENNDIQIATLIKKIASPEELFDINVVKAVPGENNNILYFSRHPVPFLRGVEPEHWISQHLFYKHIGLYGYRAPVLSKLATLQTCPPEKAESLEQLRWLYHGFRITAAITETESLSVDTPEDLSKFINIT